MNESELPLTALWLLLPVFGVLINLVHMLDEDVVYKNPTKTLFHRLWGTPSGLFFWLLAFVSIWTLINHSAGLKVPRHLFLLVAVNISYLCAVFIEAVILLSTWANENEEDIVKAKQKFIQRVLITTSASFIVSFVGFSLGLTGGITLFSATIAGVLVFSISLFS